MEALPNRVQGHRKISAGLTARGETDLGRTHQIRVHVQHVGHPILGESKYMSDKSESLTQSIGLKRLFLHAKSISFELSGEHYELDCPIDKELESVLARLRGPR